MNSNDKPETLSGQKRARFNSMDVINISNLAEETEDFQIIKPDTKYA